MPASPTLLRTLAIAAVAGLLAACGNPTGPTQNAPANSSLAIYQGSSG